MIVKTDCLTARYLALVSVASTAVLLIGQPTLNRQMRPGILAALEQRILLRYTMTGMAGTETAKYIRHHTGLASRSDTLFSDAAKLIHETGRSHPRDVNELAITSLTAAFAENKAIVGEPRSAPRSPNWR